MALILPPVTDEGRWEFRGSIDYSPNGTNQTGLRVFPPSLTRPLVRLQTIADEVPGQWKRPPDHWYLAGNLSLLHGEFRDGETYKVPLNADSVHWLNPIAYPFRVGFDAVNWLPVLKVKLYEWAEPILEDDTLEAILDRVNFLQEGITLLGQNQIQQNEAIAALSEQIAAVGSLEGGSGFSLGGTTDPVSLISQIRGQVQQSLGSSNTGLTQLFGTGITGG